MRDVWVRRVDGGKPVNTTNNTKATRQWNALDASCCHPSFEDKTIEQEATETSKTVQYSEESITIVDSCDINISSTDLQAAISLQVALQVAIGLVLSISLGDNEQADQIAQELFQKISVKQINRQHTFIENSRNVTISTTDADLTINIQVLLQVLVALLVRLDIL
ncbi:spore coat protein [Bacillus sp. RAR_GA_16]|uniref:spore coat protein n=1 Tax=Bacillus sp. RAR_GA_16 TaxID=2876774 RepID=UPI001CCAD3A6|nr:spore coat protein [Bacillus sp. RAR_GA_16]MCA0171427.1 spore coat protein [Bacillus sp. RAR_GA_16]